MSPERRRSREGPHPTTQRRNSHRPPRVDSARNGATRRANERQGRDDVVGQVHNPLTEATRTTEAGPRTAESSGARCEWRRARTRRRRRAPSTDRRRQPATRHQATPTANEHQAATVSSAWHATHSRKPDGQPRQAPGTRHPGAPRSRARTPRSRGTPRADRRWQPVYDAPTTPRANRATAPHR